MTPANVHLYYEKAWLQIQTFAGQAIMETVQEFVGQTITSIALDTAIVHVADAPFWRHVAKHASKNTTADTQDVCPTCHLSKLIAAHTKFHRNTMDAETFRGLSSVQAMPCISPDCALELCQMDDQFQPSAA
ncbi:hypothetical protein SEMRO_2096_G314270.1 [Seminavis robusta]|uniref:Uncharacterized protein n=1 Tax=Seminavis robusta TaxID=568900 RepID=A0A9N8F018_9STRA|nr:hypothetical protein SEMRO_2096_G314270.1 [Seminavis robusta]|eukprot:Sro2096_g314270.1 n/a (132) ;mRNA; f:2689-3084